MTALPRIETERLVLRPFEIHDAPSVEKLAGTREVAETTLAIPHPYPAGGAAPWIEMHAGAWQRGERLTLAICDRVGPEQLLGAISLVIEREHSRGEIGYWIAREKWGRGYASEAAHAVTGYAFADVELHRVQGRCFTRNPASARVMQKLGMRLEGVHRQAHFRFGRFEDSAMYAILAAEWNALRATTSRPADPSR